MKFDDVPTHASGSVLSAENKDHVPLWQVPMKLWHRITLGAIMLLSCGLNFILLQQNGYGNAFYAACVRSMLGSWHNFFFVSFDPGGFVTVDKPPLGLWLQAISAKIFELLGFGFNYTSLLLPQVIAGILAVLLLYHLVRRSFGPGAGLIAALALALTPISVAMNRDNNLDPTLVFTLLLAAWSLMKAVETGRLRWLLLCALLVGCGFNIKTLEAYLVVPAFGLFYLLGAHHSWGKRILHLCLAVVLLLVVSFAWLVAVDMTPASQRPYVDSSQTNSEIELAFGYNGIERLTGNMFGGSSNRDTARSTNQQSSSSQTTPPSTTTQAATGNTPPSQGTQGSSESGPGAAGFGTGGAGGIGGGIFDEGGPPSLFRLLTPDLGSQVGWLLPLALMGLLAMTWQERFRLPLNRWHLGLALWGVWFLACGTFFSVAGFFHSYYLVIIAPAICALTGIGLVTMWREYRTLPLNKRRTWALPIALIFTAIEQVHMLSFYQPYDSILIPLVIIVSVVVVLLLLVTKLNIQLRFNRNLLSIIQRPAVVVCMIAFLLAPTVWTVITVLNPTNETVPTAGPTITSVNSATAAMLNQFAQYLRTEYGIPGAGGTGIEGNPLAGRSGVSGMPGAFGSETTVNTKLVNYLEQNKGNAKYLVAYSSSSEAAPLIIQTGQPVMSLGGFLGSDPILTQSQLQQLIKAGTIRFFMLSGNRTAGTTGSSANNSNQTSGAGNISGGGIAIGGGIMGSGSNAQLISWVESNCKPVSSALWETQQQSSNTSPQRGGFGGMNQTLYDCATIKTQS